MPTATATSAPSGDDWLDQVNNYRAIAGVPLVSEVAKECYLGWAQQNLPYSGHWRVGGTRIRPEMLDQPTFIAAPQHDRIVPSGCALPLADLIPDNQLIEPEAGHIGMLVGRERKQQLWQPFLKWIKHTGK